MKIRIAIGLMCFISLSLFSCRFSLNSEDISIIKHNKWDVKVIPDKYNTGADESKNLKKVTASGYIANNVYVSLRGDTNQYNLSSSKENINTLPNKVVIRNLDFSEHDFLVMGTNKYANTKYITFENCKFKGFSNEAVEPGQSRVYITFNHCSFGGNVKTSYITLNDCKIGGFISDAINPLREFYANNLYIYDLVHETTKGDVHIDGIQIYGDPRSRNNAVNGIWYTKVETGEIHFNNVRFEIPSIHYDNMPEGTAVNACVMFQLEYSDVNNVSFENLYVNGGGKWYPLYMDHGGRHEHSIHKEWQHENLSMKDAMVSNNFGTIFYPNFIAEADVQNVDHHNQLFVSSVWQDKGGQTHIIVSNDTNTDKTLTVKSDIGIYEFEVPHCPSNWALNGEPNNINHSEALKDANGRSYTTYRFEDMPFDKEVIVPGSPSFVVCYDGKKQIRYVNFRGTHHHYLEIKNNKEN